MSALDQYRRHAIEGKTGVGLVVVLYDALVSALYNGALSMKNGDIESRTKSLNQAMRIAGHLQATLNHAKGGEVASSLNQYYSALMAEVLRASATSDANILEKQIEHAAALAEAWREVERQQPRTI